MKNALTRRQRERLVSAWVERMLEYDRVHIDFPTSSPDPRDAYSSGRLAGLSDALEAILIDRERGADWAEFNSISDEINARVDAARGARDA